MPVPPLPTNSYACILPERRGAHKKECRGRGHGKRLYERTDFGPAIYSTSTRWPLGGRCSKMRIGGWQLNFSDWVISDGSIQGQVHCEWMYSQSAQASGTGRDRGNKHEGHFSRKQSVGAHVLSRPITICRPPRASG